MKKQVNEDSLENIAEELVKEKVKEIMASYDICQCEKCFLDVCAIVLNSIDPRYVTTEKGRIFALLENNDYQYLTIIILQALNEVKDKPQHDQ